MAVLDVDWQRATEIWGLGVTIPGILKGTFLPSSHQSMKQRFDPHSYNQSRGYAFPLMGRYKSKLANVTWYDEHYKELFRKAKYLSMTLTIDLFDQITCMGRVTGTIGITSKDSPLQMTGSRIFQLDSSSISSLGSAPFYYHEKDQVLTVDLSVSTEGFQNGSITTGSVGQLDLAALMPVYNLNGVTKWSKITTGGHISSLIGNSSTWYTIYGGVLDIDLSHLSSSILQALTHTRIGIMNEKQNVHLAELPFGMSYGFLGRSIFRLNVGESEAIQVFVSSFGEPVKNAQVNVHRQDGVLASAVCSMKSCNNSLGLPSSAIGISSDSKVILTDRFGLASVELTALHDPGNVRGCGLDGQVYPLEISIRYRRGKRSWRFPDNKDGESSGYAIDAIAIAARIYNSLPEKQCPAWNDVKEIFLQYYNLYPVMWKYGIIDLHSYDDIRRQSKMLTISMFHTPMSDPRYMPISRDLSSGKKRLIHNWIKCGMLKDQRAVDESCTRSSLEHGISEVQISLEKAIMVELATIPVYMTAWFSLKTEFGRNIEIAAILKSIFHEEMLHLALAANVLNSVGGSVNLTDERKLPTYPTLLTARYQILPNVELTLAPFSIGLVDQVFSAIERPSDSETKKIIKYLGSTWRHMFWADVSTIGGNMKMLLNEDDHKRNGSYFNTSTFTNSSEAFPNSSTAWNNLRIDVAYILNTVSEKMAKSIGGLYSMIALKLISLESCAKLLDNAECSNNGTNTCEKGTIFTGNDSHQLNMSHWYQRSKDSIFQVIEGDSDIWANIDRGVRMDKTTKTIRPPLFMVNDLKSALEAIVEIIYQGEGGSECTPLVPDKEVYASLSGRDQGYELSHYYRFQEIVHGKKLVKLQSRCEWSAGNCLEKSTTSACSIEAKTCYCYAGEPLAFYADGVWPILFNAKAKDYVEGSKVHQLNEQFNLLYTRLLICLQDAFQGNPSAIKKCMSTMYDITIAGKRLVQTPIQGHDMTKRGLNGAPTWSFVRELWYRAGFPIRI